MDTGIWAPMIRVPESLEVNILQDEKWFHECQGIHNTLTALGLTYDNIISPNKDGIAKVVGLRIANLDTY